VTSQTDQIAIQQADDPALVRKRSLAFLEQEQLGYQAVELPGGVVTPGHDRGYLKQMLFGDDFSGRSLLDIGSYLGYFCIDALRRGGAEAVGIETDPQNVRQARAIADLWQLDPEYIQADFEEWPGDGRRFDVVACLNVLHHLYDPVHALRRMSRMAREKIVLEVAVPTWRDVARDLINPLRVAGIGAPAVFLGVPKKRGDAAGRTFLFTPGALRILFNTHTSVFEPVTIARSPFKGRILVEARKRRIGHLAVVAGPTAVGKSTFAARLVKDRQLRERMGLDGDGWRVVDASEIAELTPGRHDRLILHYDLLRPSRTGIRSHDRDPVLHLMGIAEQLTTLTLMAPADQLRKQLRQGEMAKPDRTTRQRKRDAKLLASYQTPRFLDDWYAGWAAFSGRHAGHHARHLVVRVDRDCAPEPLERWRQAFESCFAEAG